MKRGELIKIRKAWIQNHVTYKLCHWTKFNYDILSNIMYLKRSGRGDSESWADVIIMADTETSKKYKRKLWHNHVCAWTISIRFFDMNIVTLYGHRPDTICDCFEKLRDNIPGDRFIIFFHNLPYDYTFLRRFLFKKFGYPKDALNVKSHYPLFINFNNGMQLRDSLMLAQRKLEKWADDLDVEHKKAVGKWDYDKIRTQKEVFTDDELEYIEHDTLAGVECIDKTLKALNKKIYSLPYTATGIPRGEVKKRGKLNNAKELFRRIAPTYEQYEKLLKVFHGGFTHANRYLIGETIKGLISCFDFASSYPFVLLSEKYPCERFTKMPDCKLDEILSSSENYAFMFKLILIRPRLKDDFIPMPVLQESKTVKSINPVLDNGRILGADYVEIYVNEQDASVIDEQYKTDGSLCVEVESARKDYLPRWFTDYIFELFSAKCKLKETKDQDPVSYAIAKATLNSLYGLTVQRSIRDVLNEVYEYYVDDEGIEHFPGEYVPDKTKDEKKEYEKYLNKQGSILPFFYGVWCTSYAMKNLFELGKCIKKEEGEKVSHWIYSDTDSIYSDAWDLQKVEEYNQKAKEKLQKNKYGPVVVNHKEYWLGVAEHEEGKDDYTEFRTLGAKRYCGRNLKDGEIHITVAGVPKKGAVCLNDNIRKFKKGFIFSGSKTGKLTHNYYYVDDIYTDKWGNLTGDSINLTPCNYLLDDVKLDVENWWELFSEEVEIQVYE